MKHNEFSEIDQITGDVLREKLLALVNDSAGCLSGQDAICLITLPDGRQAEVGLYFQTEEDEISL